MIYGSKNDPDIVCRALYRTISRECRRYGLAEDQIQRSRELSQQIGDKYYLVEAAYRPTGIALGCPLPDSRVTRKLWRIAQLIECYLKSLCQDEKTFAFVPPDAYHITLVNRSHFDITPTIIPMTKEEKEKSQQIIAQAGLGAIQVHLNGLIVTRSGRLIVPGFPCDNRLYHLRARLTELVPELCVYVPKIVHIKIGHLLASLDFSKTQSLLCWIARCGEMVSFRVYFDDVYTPVGRISL